MVGPDPSAVRQDLRDGLRILAKQPGFSAVAVLTLALGIGATTAIFSLVHAVVIRPLPFSAQERLVVAWKKDTTAYSPWAELSYPEFEDWQAQSTSFASLAAMPTLSYGQGFVLMGRGEPALVESTRVTGRFFTLLGVRAALGRGLDERDDLATSPKVVVVSHRLWRDYLDSDPKAVGRSLVLTGDSYTVVGVLPPSFEFPKGVDLWLTFAATSSRRTLENRGATFLQVVGRLRPGVTVREAEAELDTIIARVAHEHPETQADGHRAVVTPLAEHLLGSARPALWLLLAATGMLLLMACANVANLSLARATSRRRELSLRAALGASRGRLVRQLASESLVLALIGGAGGLLLARGLLAFLVHLAPPDIPRIEDAGLQGEVLLYGTVATLLTVFVFGLLPALTASRMDLNETLGEGSHRLAGERAGKRQREVLIVAEVAVGVVLLLGATLVLRSFWKLSDVELGFEPRNVLTVQLRPRGPAYDEPESRRAFFRQLALRLESQPGVEAASAVLIRPLEGTVGWDASYVAEGQSGEEAARNAVANFEVVQPHYFRVFGIALVAGREFTEDDDLSRPGVVILSQGLAARLFGSAHDAVGKRLRLDSSGESWRTVVGVAADVRYRELQGVRPDVYVPLEQSARALINHFALRTTTEPMGLLSTLRRELRGARPTASHRQRRHPGRSVGRPSRAAAVWRGAAELAFRARAAPRRGGDPRGRGLLGRAAHLRDRPAHGRGRDRPRRPAARRRRGHAAGPDRGSGGPSDGGAPEPAGGGSAVWLERDRSVHVRGGGGDAHDDGAPGLLAPRCTRGEGRSHGGPPPRLGRACLRSSAVDFEGPDRV